MFAQANSEHCRHKIFNASFTIDGVAQERSMFGMIRHTHQVSPQHTVIAYSDNASVMEGGSVERFVARPGTGSRYEKKAAVDHVLMKVETHNHPTAISPFPGASTGAGGEIRDEGATGRGSRPKAGLTGFTVSRLWGGNFGKPEHIASPLADHGGRPARRRGLQQRIRPALPAGLFPRIRAADAGDVMRGYHKPIMIAGGLGTIDAGLTKKIEFPAGTLLIQLGGPGMRIGMGGGAASSMATGANAAELDFDSVQRGNPEIERRAQEVINHCWARGRGQPHPRDPRRGRGRPVQCLSRTDQRRRPRREVRPAQDPAGRIRARAQGNLVQREPGALRAGDRAAVAGAVQGLLRARALPVRRRRRGDARSGSWWWAMLDLPLPASGKGGWLQPERSCPRPSPPPGERASMAVDMPMNVLLGKPPKMHRDVKTVRREFKPVDLTGVSLQDAAIKVLGHPTVASKRFLVTIGDRTVGGLSHRDQMVGPWQVPVADCAVTLADYKGFAGEAMSMGERTPLAAIDAPASGRMAVAEAITNLLAAPIELARVKLSANWMAACGEPGRGRRAVRNGAGGGHGAVPGAGHFDPGGQGQPVDADAVDRAGAATSSGASTAKKVTSPVSLIVSAFATLADVRGTLTPQLDATQDTTLVLIDLGRGPQPHGRQHPGPGRWTRWATRCRTCMTRRTW